MADLPKGIVTFCFTDIEGSTRLVQHLGEQRYGEVLAEHHRLLRAAFQERGGYDLGMEGDAFFLVFARATDAVAAVIAAQRALAAHPWPDEATVRVRMGLHTGEAIILANNYVGLDINRAARICSAGHGGQVLLSQSTRDLVENDLPEGVTLRDLGEHRLKDLRRPERLFQVVAPDLTADFPAIKIMESLDSHYETVIKAIRDGRLVPFFGSGVNLCGRPAGAKWQGEGDKFDYLPTDSELAEYLARKFDYPANAPLDLVRVSQYIAVMVGSGPLYDELHALYDADYPPTSLHKFFATLPGILRNKGYSPRYQLIVSTNYDDVLERAFQAADEPFDLVSYIAEGEQRGKFMHWPPGNGEGVVIEKPNEYRSVSLDQRTVIMKIHGAVDRPGLESDSFVITEDHYIDYLTRTDISNLIPVTLTAKLRKSHFLFLGYSLRDWNLRVIMHRIWGQQKLSYKSWSIQLQPEPVDQESWRKREVDTINVRLENYIAALSESLQALTRVGGGA